MGTPCSAGGDSCPTWLVAEQTSYHRLADGTVVLVRPLLYGDRLQLAEGLRRLSPAARRQRFFTEQGELSEEELEYLTNIDFKDHRAWAAFLLEEPGLPGVGVARWIRDPTDPTRAEVAVTVLDEHQGRGIGTLLITLLADDAYRHGVHTLVGYVWWGNATMLEPLQRVGARVEADEPGIAHVEVDLPLTLGRVRSG